MKSRAKRVRKPPDLTSLFDVMFIVVFVALIRAAAAEHAAAAVKAPEPPPKPVAPPPLSADVVVLQRAALSTLATRAPLVLRIAGDKIISLEADGKKLPLDVPLLEHDPNPDVGVKYLGDRSSELQLCRIAAVHLNAADLAPYLVIVAVEKPLADLPHALFDGLHRDLDRCMVDQRGLATLVDPTIK